MQDSITLNLRTIRNRIKLACIKSNRSPSEVHLLLATKTVSSEKIKFALRQGESLIGENKVQELKQKCTSLLELKPQVHFIGHLQSNKIKEVIKWVTCIESLDNYSLAEKLNNRLLFEKKSIDVFIQVNTSYEESKFGVAPDQAIELIKKIAKLESIRVKGLMTIGLFGAAPEDSRKCFKLLKNIQEQVDELKIPKVEMQELSMGMSRDLEIAIEEGATIIRVGTAIFGERKYPDSYYWNEEQL